MTAPIQQDSHQVENCFLHEMEDLLSPRKLRSRGSRLIRGPRPPDLKKIRDRFESTMRTPPTPTPPPADPRSVEIRARNSEPQLPVFRCFCSVWTGFAASINHLNLPMLDLRARILCAKRWKVDAGEGNARVGPKVKCLETNVALWNKWKVFWLLAQVERRLTGGSTRSPVSSGHKTLLKSPLYGLYY